MNLSAAVAAASLPRAEHAPCVLVNPRSFSASRRALAERAAKIATDHGATVIHAADSAEIDAAADLMVARRQRLAIVLAGDGTIRAVADRLAAAATGVAPPKLLVLGGGRTNLTAGEFGGSHQVLSKLEAALRRHREGIPFAHEQRHLLEITQPPAPPRRGFFVAAGLVDYAIRACHRYRLQGSGALRHGAAGTAWTLARFALSSMRGKLDASLDDLRIDVPSNDAHIDAAHLLVVTTLQRRQGALDPYAERGQGALRFTAITARGAAFWVRLPWLATGRFARGMDCENGYLSGRCEALRVQHLSSYTVDGEEYAAEPSRPVTITLGPMLTFATL